MDESDEKPSHQGAVRAVLSLLSRTGPEVPPDAMHPPASSSVGNEPTELLPVIHPPAPAAPKVVARAVIVYEPEPRRSRGLLVFTAVLLALTVGVVLGQANAYQPVSRSAATAPTAPVPPYGAPPEGIPGPAGQASPVPAGQVAAPLTAPLGSVKARVLEVTGAGALLRIRSGDLGGLLFSVATTDGSVLPVVVDTPRGPLITLAPPGVNAGRTEIQLHAKVRWTIRLTGGSATQAIDMSAGGLAGFELVGGASQAVLTVPRPAGSVTLRVSGPVADLRIRAGKGAVRLRLGKGADTATFEGRKRSNVKAGTALVSPGWRSAKNRYDIAASARVGAVVVARGR